VFCIAIYVLRERLRLVEDEEVEAKARIKTLHDAARIGIADIRRDGTVVDERTFLLLLDDVITAR
jgi:hypothetical protein